MCSKEDAISAITHKKYKTYPHSVLYDMSIQFGCKMYNRILHIVAVALNVCVYIYNTITFPNIKISTENACFH